MKISPGDPWGSAGHVPLTTPIVRTDAELAALVSNGRRTGVVAGLAGGDLCRTLGGRGDIENRLGSEATLVEIDVGRVEADGAALGCFVAHVLARGWAWSGPGAAVMNSEWMGEWDLAPRAHPGDGLLDVVEGRLGPRQLLIARRRVPSGDHLPHPSLKARRSATVELDFSRERLIFIDGTAAGKHRVVKAELGDETVTVAV